MYVQWALHIVATITEASYFRRYFCNKVIQVATISGVYCTTVSVASLWLSVESPSVEMCRKQRRGKKDASPVFSPANDDNPESPPQSVSGSRATNKYTRVRERKSNHILRSIGVFEVDRRRPKVVVNRSVLSVCSCVRWWLTTHRKRQISILPPFGCCFLAWLVRVRQPTTYRSIDRPRWEKVRDKAPFTRRTRCQQRQKWNKYCTFWEYKTERLYQSFIPLCTCALKSRFNEWPPSPPFYSLNRDLTLNRDFLMWNFIWVIRFRSLNWHFTLNWDSFNRDFTVDKLRWCSKCHAEWDKKIGKFLCFCG